MPDTDPNLGWHEVEVLQLVARALDRAGAGTVIAIISQLDTVGVEETLGQLRTLRSGDSLSTPEVIDRLVQRLRYDLGTLNRILYDVRGLEPAVPPEVTVGLAALQMWAARQRPRRRRHA
jgi:hypothetical protein